MSMMCEKGESIFLKCANIDAISNRINRALKHEKKRKIRQAVLKHGKKKAGQ